MSELVNQEGKYFSPRDITDLAFFCFSVSSVSSKDPGGSYVAPSKHDLVIFVIDLKWKCPHLQHCPEFEFVSSYFCSFERVVR